MTRILQNCLILVNPEERRLQLQALQWKYQAFRSTEERLRERENFARKNSLHGINPFAKVFFTWIFSCNKKILVKEQLGKLRYARAQ